MARTSESKVKDEICRELHALGIRHYRFTPGPYMASGLPDILAFPGDGIVWWLEAKARGAKKRYDGSEELQWRRIKELRAKGYVAGIVCSWADVCALVRESGKDAPISV